MQPGLSWSRTQNVWNYRSEARTPESPVTVSDVTMEGVQRWICIQ